MAQVSSHPIPSGLPSFEGREVREMAIIVNKAGDGLSDALKVDKVPHHHGDEVFLVLRTFVTKVNHVEVKPGSDDLRRVETLTAQDAFEVDESDIGPLFRRAKDTVRRKLDEAAGIVPLFAASSGDDDVVPFEDMSDEQQSLYVGHGQGEHASGPVEECPLCDSPPLREGDDW